MELKDYELGRIRDYSSFTFLSVYNEELLKNDDKDCLKRIPRGYVFVSNKKIFGATAKWKPPGGHLKWGETPLDTAVRELLEETNLAPEISTFRYEGKWLGPRENHWMCLFSADIHERKLCWMNSSHPENEGEVPKFFTPGEFYELVRSDEFMQKHYDKLVEYALILPLGRDQKPA